MEKCPICLAPLTPKGNCTFCRYQVNPPGFVRTWVVPVLGLVIFSVALGYYAIEVFKPLMTDMVSSFSSNSTEYSASVPPPETTYNPDNYPQLSATEIRELRSLFDNQLFEQLNERFDAFQAAAEEDPRNEKLLLRACDTFALADNELRPNFDLWITLFPEHYAPYLARAEHTLALALERRGTAYASETSEEQFAQMHDYLRETEADLDAARQINPRLVPAYVNAITIHNLEGNESLEQEVFDTGRVYAPASFALYDSMLWAHKPRWGGSYCEMDTLIRQALEYSEQNPKLYMLFVSPYADLAWYARRDKDYDKALELYATALAYGESFYIYRERAKTYRLMQNYSQAYADIQRSLELESTSIRNHIEAARILYKLGDLDASILHVYEATLLAPEDKELPEMQDWALRVTPRSTLDNREEVTRVLSLAVY